MNTQAEDPASAPADTDAEQVAAYLRTHPDFLAHHDELLSALEVPHRPGGGATSLIERQVGTLRQRNERLERRLGELLHTARDNQRLGDRLLALGRGLLEADSLDDVLALVREALQSEFAAEEVVILLIANGNADPGADSGAHADGRFVAPDDPVLTPFAAVLSAGDAVCGELNGDQRDALFGEHAPRVASGALVPLRRGRATGLIALGSHDPEHFGSDMGTLFLDRLGELVSTAVARHLGTL